MFFLAVVKYMRNKAEVDWNAVAVEQRLKNAEVAKVRFGQIKRKLGISSAGDGPATPTSRAHRTLKKRDGSVMKTPPKDSDTEIRAMRAKPKHFDEEAEDDEDDENSEANEDDKQGFGAFKHEDDSDFEKLVKKEKA
ncbi:hypothetical protein CDD82_326 [Ophiocordyceps australis]|uniref:Uncharacterized protein n=1 Tax=Ophiocordyceps australis TaxID=1399860 RepID=A0A2C5ZP85_9HYPO|nr:hypothetical protein CDD82_326 [Ophiocordyceps australis]